MAANTFSSTGTSYDIPHTSNTIEMFPCPPSFKLNQERRLKRPTFRTPSPGRIISGSEITARLGYSKEVQKHFQEERRQKRKVSDRYKEFVEMLTNKYRSLLHISNQSERQKVSNEIRICEVRFLQYGFNALSIVRLFF